MGHAGWGGSCRVDGVGHVGVEWAVKKNHRIL